MSASDLGERIGKRLARAGVASRREAERMVVDGRVAVDGTVVTNPAVKVGPESRVTVDGVLLGEPAPSRFVVRPQTQRNARSIRRTTTAGVAAGNTNRRVRSIFRGVATPNKRRRPCSDVAGASHRLETPISATDIR